MRVLASVFAIAAAASLCHAQPDRMYAVYADRTGYFDGLYRNLDIPGLSLLLTGPVALWSRLANRLLAVLGEVPAGGNADAVRELVRACGADVPVLAARKLENRYAIEIDGI